PRALSQNVPETTSGCPAQVDASSLHYFASNHSENIRGFSIPPTTVELVSQFGIAAPTKYLYATPDLSLKRELDMVPIVFGRVEEENEEDDIENLPENEANLADNSAIAEQMDTVRDPSTCNKRKSSLITENTPAK
ncbi:hypothetical protein PFISCL1PPCAC_8515, partial [Pristionchus fissidentatus]